MIISCLYDSSMTALNVQCIIQAAGQVNHGQEGSGLGHQ